LHTTLSTTYTSLRRYISAVFSTTVLVAASIFILSQSQVQAAQSFKPQASKAFVQTLTDNVFRGKENALLSVVYDLKQWEINGHKRPEIQKIRLDKQTVVLRDDGEEGDETPGDGIFSAFVVFDFKALLFKYERLEKESGKEAMPPAFKNREQIGRVEFIKPGSKGSQPPLILPFTPSEIMLAKRITPNKPTPPINYLLDSVSATAIDVVIPIMSTTILAERIALGTPIPLISFGIADAIDAEKSLLIRDLSVVEDPSRTFNICTGNGNPNGVWTFKHLVTEMANTAKTGITPEAFVRMWLSQWETSQNINGWPVPDRNAGIRNSIIIPWENASGGAGQPLDLDKAPFQLMAMANRVDLRENLAYGGGSAGEGRFVFQVMDQNVGCTPMQFTVIFEYGIEKKSCSAVKDWGQSWANLSDMILGSPAYNTALENITESFVRANAVPSKPNGSALNQLRTNELALAKPWELREFVIADAGWNQHFLKPNTVALTPDTSLNGSSTLASYFASGISGVPLRFPALADPFRGGASTVPFPGFFWNAPGFPTNLAEIERRHEFSLNTCNGCHAGETNTFFTHIKPGVLPVSLSGFMTGINVNDPALLPPPFVSITRHFNELVRRSTDLDDLVHSSCFSQLPRKILKAVH